MQSICVIQNNLCELHQLGVLYYMIIEIQNLFQLQYSYLIHFCPYINNGIVGCSWGITSVYIWRYYTLNHIGNFLFKQTNEYEGTCMNDILIFLLGLCWFFGIKKFLRFCQFYRFVTFKYLRKSLISLITIFSFVFIIFLTLFLDKICHCSTLLNLAQMLFEMMLIKFDTNEVQDVIPYLGPLCFSLFIFLTFITIINHISRIIQKNVNVNLNEYNEIFKFIFRNN